MHGTSKYMSPGAAQFIYAAEFQDFAPASCVCYNCCISADQKSRTYARIYENKLEYNYPIAPFCCLTSELCLHDNIMVHYFDKPPSRSGLFCGVIPCTICGPPVLFTHKPKCLCLDLSEYYGEHVKAAPCNCFGLKSYLCCGNPCYVDVSYPILNGLKNSSVFASAMKQAVDSYRVKHGLPTNQMAIFQDVNDNVFDFGKAKDVQAPVVGQAIGRQDGL